MSDKTMPDNETAAPLIDRRYRSLSKLGEGGFGSVCLVEDTWFGHRRLALKVLLKQHQEDADFERRFRDEIDVLRSLRHPAISEIINDGRTAAGEFYFTMEFVEGTSLDVLLKAEAPLDPARVLRFIHQLLDVLSAAEERRVVHRDLKPKNIMVEEPGTPAERLKILDFGIAKVVRPKGESWAEAQHTQGVLGTPDYLAPEQIRGQELDTRTDLYAMGIIVHQMLSGEFPFEGATSEARMAARLVTPPRALPGKVPPALRRLVEMLLETDRERRPTPAEARIILEPQATRRRKPWVTAGLGALSLAVAAGAVWMLLHGRGGSTSPVITPPQKQEPEPTTELSLPIETANPDSKPADKGPNPAGEVVKPKEEKPKPPEPSTASPPAPVVREYRFSTYPGFAEVYVDDEAQNSNETGWFVHSLRTGEHRFRVRAEGAEITLTYVVKREDIQTTLVLDYERGIVRPPSR